MCDEKDVSQLCRIKSMENGLLGIILKSLFSIDVQTYFLFFAANRIRIRDITVKTQNRFSHQRKGMD